MIETKEQWEDIKQDVKSGISTLHEKRLVKLIEALLNMARWAWHLDNCKTQMTGNRPCNCGYQELRDALPDWITEDG